MFIKCFCKTFQIGLFKITFKDGRVTDVSAEQGEEVLRRLLDTDEGAKHLGEVALVPHASPISQSELLFYNTLFMKMHPIILPSAVRMHSVSKMEKRCPAKNSNNMG